MDVIQSMNVAVFFKAREVLLSEIYMVFIPRERTNIPLKSERPADVLNLSNSDRFAQLSRCLIRIHMPLILPGKLSGSVTAEGCELAGTRQKQVRVEFR